jgi:hypothetical protein
VFGQPHWLKLKLKLMLMPLSSKQGGNFGEQKQLACHELLVVGQLYMLVMV